MRQIKAATVDFSDPQPIVALLQSHAHLADPSQPQAQVAQDDAERDWREAHAAADARCASAFARLKDFATTLQPAVGLQARASHRIGGYCTVRTVWSGLVWSGLVWSGLVWSGLVWSGLGAVRSY
jgi:hypothetical protein